MSGAAHLLREDELARYASAGYVVPSYRLPPAALAALRDSADRLIAENPAVRPEHLVLRWGGGAAALPSHARVLEAVRRPELLDIVAQLLGPDIICWGAHLFCKPAGDGLEVPWHQDGHYWPIRPLATITVWLALDHSGPDNGCLRVLPGSHRARRLFAHRTEARPELAIDEVIDDPGVDLTTAVDVCLEPGQLSIHDVYMVHGSAANRSGRRRAGLAVRYMPASSLYDRTIRRRGGAAALRQDMSRRPIYLVRGRDRAGNDFETGQDRPFEVGSSGDT